MSMALIFIKSYNPGSMLVKMIYLFLPTPQDISTFDPPKQTDLAYLVASVSAFAPKTETLRQGKTLRVQMEQSVKYLPSLLHSAVPDPSSTKPWKMVSSPRTSGVL